MVFWVLDVMLWNIWVIVQFRVAAGDEYYQMFKDNKGVPNGRYRFQLELADQLIAYSLEAAIAEAGGDRRKVKWAAQIGRGQFQSPTGSSSSFQSPPGSGGSFKSPAAGRRTPQTPLEAVECPLSHELVPHGSKSNTYCQLCYQYKTDKDTRSKAERRKDSNKTNLKCELCRMRVCPVCHKDGTHHQF